MCVQQAHHPSVVAADQRGIQGVWVLRKPPSSTKNASGKKFTKYLIKLIFITIDPIGLKRYQAVEAYVYRKQGECKCCISA